MIEVFNIETAHKFGDALPALLKCRYREFVLRQKYEVPSYNHMEYDQYDTPAAVYFVWRDKGGNVKGGMRILPTNRQYMLKEIWPNAISSIKTPESQSIWELTRYFIDDSIANPQERKKAHGEILCALLEFALHNGINNYIAIAPPLLWDFTYTRCGWPARPIGNLLNIGYTEDVQAGILDVSPEILQNVRAQMKIKECVLDSCSLPIECVYVPKPMTRAIRYVPYHKRPRPIKVIGGKA